MAGLVAASRLYPICSTSWRGIVRTAGSAVAPKNLVRVVLWRTGIVLGYGGVGANARHHAGGDGDSRLARRSRPPRHGHAGRTARRATRNDQLPPHSAAPL